MAHHQRNSSIASSTKPATPTDSWESYFDSWRVEDDDVPDMAPPPAPTILEPVILDDELYHPDSLLNAQFNLDRALDLELDWDFQEYHHDYQDRCSPKVFGRLNDDNPANKRHAICVSNRRAAAAAYCQGQSRRDRRPVPVIPMANRPDDVDRIANMGMTGMTQIRQPFAQLQEDSSRSGHGHGASVRRSLQGHQRRSDCCLAESLSMGSPSSKRPHRAMQRKEHFRGAGGVGNPQQAEPLVSFYPPAVLRVAVDSPQTVPYDLIAQHLYTHTP
ncbi:uncharacterized protein Z519_10852 [Cladophialophora bantiana CBS 173.52]|uniref:Uncharacterized protein n=1 Tax=Cladophialophora bantiana (strain ATCC 10958 / CBS 173.52 / CDC B-1940 / NIH 8579) TaxID=1442370 RepID=A0A0D2HBH6_CLAB1|nr:uncharacterized protein Z519_10852 [Cladophialophora bantiana CBS 173.52]KIW88285.1 hypothetical protein Z519_10852 [Cladophialophora bantiana CBS 173.52]